jgi:hypothetical protein
VIYPKKLLSSSNFAINLSDIHLCFEIILKVNSGCSSPAKKISVLELEDVVAT